jgi:hypothetical protein
VIQVSKVSSDDHMGASFPRYSSNPRIPYVFNHKKGKGELVYSNATFFLDRNLIGMIFYKGKLD